MKKLESLRRRPRTEICVKLPSQGHGPAQVAFLALAPMAHGSVDSPFFTTLPIDLRERRDRPERMMPDSTNLMESGNWTLMRWG